MKKRLLIPLLLLAFISAQGQDVIVTTDLKLIPAYQLELGQLNVYYQLSDTDTATIHRIPKAQIQLIRYADGKTFDPNAATAPSQTYGSVTYRLDDRTAKVLLPSNMRSPRSGKVVVKIWVNRDGKVTKVLAPIAGSTIIDSHIVKQLKLLAHQAVFSPNPDAPAEQLGEIIYTF